jgi:quinoprotein glucose dehydrogenase
LVRRSTAPWLAWLAIVTIGSAGLLRANELGAGSEPSAPPVTVEWRHYAADLASSKYSPADLIDASNVATLEVAWRYETPDLGVQTKAPAGNLKGTPLMIGSVLYTVSSLQLVTAVDARTGEELWRYDPWAYELGVPTHGGFTQRGIEWWSDGERERLFLVTGVHQLVSLDPATGKPDPTFGDNGVVDMRPDVGPPEVQRLTGLNSPPVVCGDTVIMGMTINDFGLTQKMPAGHVRGYDARTGQRRWVFHTVPQEGEAGVETWLEESWRISGGTNVWSMLSCDPELGMVYLPTGTPSSDYYGGHRHGDNLYAESLVALDAATGARVWHFQAVRHGLWDYDFPCAPNLVDLEIGGRTIPAVAQVSKQGFTYVFDRRTGEPIWPIEDRPVAKSDVPGEWTAPTQPFPTKPPPFERQGVTDADLNDLTRELLAEAREIFQQFVGGPLFTPPIVGGQNGKKAMVQLPGQAGGANWGGAAYDPETDVLYVPSQTRLGTMALVEPTARQASDRRYLPQFVDATGPQGLPLVKPPWSRLTAIDLREGTLRFQVPVGDGPIDHPALAGKVKGPLGSWPMSGLSPGWPMVTKTLVFVVQAVSTAPIQDDEASPRDGPATGYLFAFDKTTGEEVVRIELPNVPGGAPMTYALDGEQTLVVPVGRRGKKQELIAYRLPEPMIRGAQQAPAATAAARTSPSADPQAAWWNALRDLCGEAFAGALANHDEADRDLVGQPMVMHVRRCTDTRIEVPFHIGENRSRTWVLERSDQGIHLAHDHRHEDGSPDAVTFYGGRTTDRGTAALQQFPADDYSKQLFVAQGIPQSATNVWSMELVPGERFSYVLRRSNRHFRVDFDLRETVAPPPPPWGHD